VSTALDPVIAGANFCAYETNKDYASAYRQLSTNLQSQVSEQRFISDNQARDTTLGPVVGCSLASQPSSSLDQVPASPIILTLNIWLGSTAGNTAPVNRSGDLTMVEEGTDWKVDAIDSTLQLT